MASWWRQVAEQLGVTGTGSWKRRAAQALQATEGGTGPWPRHIAVEEGTTEGTGPWSRRIAEGNDAAAGTGPWARRLALNAGVGVIIRADSSVIKADSNKVTADGRRNP